jgi:hypothetical protein
VREDCLDRYIMFVWYKKCSKNTRKGDANMSVKAAVHQNADGLQGCTEPGSANSCLSTL